MPTRGNRHRSDSAQQTRGRDRRKLRYPLLSLGQVGGRSRRRRTLGTVQRECGPERIAHGDVRSHLSEAQVFQRACDSAPNGARARYGDDAGRSSLDAYCTPQGAGLGDMARNGRRILGTCSTRRGRLRQRLESGLARARVAA